ncbi:MAG: winged helix-turn-helix transcriptional regulator [Methylococcales bacterium]|nr:winged helix-turn-helix transcriptional regulator [Methylococcales bacterium]
MEHAKNRRSGINRRSEINRRKTDQDEIKTNNHVSIAGYLRIDARLKKVYLEEKQIHLTRKEFDLLKFLSTDTGRVFSDNEIINTVWADEFDACANNVKQYIYFLRKKIEKDPHKPLIIQTIKGFGYRLVLTNN